MPNPLSHSIRPAIFSNQETTPDIIEISEYLQTRNQTQWSLRVEEFRELETIIDTLNTRKDAIFAHCKHHHDYDFKIKSLKAPYRKLPNEIISNILLLCIPIKSSHFKTWINTYQILTHICSHWKKIAINTCTLWEKLKLTIEVRYINAAYNLIAKWTEYMRHNTLKLHMAFTIDIMPVDQMTNFLKVLDNNPRISELLIQFQLYPLSVYGNALNITLPEAVKLIIYEHEISDRNILPTQINQIKIHTPKISDLELRIRFFDKIHIENFHNITTLSLQILENSFADMKAIIDKCSKLISLCLFIDKMLPEEDPVQIDIPSVEDLIVTSIANIDDVLIYFNTPNLRNFGLRWWYHFTPLEDFNKLLPFFQTTSKLSHVLIQGPDIPQNKKDNFTKEIKYLNSKIQLKFCPVPERDEVAIAEEEEEEEEPAVT